jgi:hypothetical protein
MRCATWAREEGVDPIGTAGCVEGFLLVDWPLPWPRDAADVEALAPVHQRLAGTGVRLQLVVPEGDDDTRAVVLHRRRAADGDWFAGFERVARAVATADVVDVAADLLDTGTGDPDADGGRAGDVLVCGHGARDRCCGSAGTRLALEARAASGLEVRRTSHTGGHRFAATGIVLPDATVWAYLDADALARVTSRTGPLDDLLGRYRGCAGLAPRGAQALEREALAEVGWSWFDHRRRGTDLGDGRFRLDAVAPDGTELAWEAEIGDGRRLPVPDCGEPIEAAKKFETELVVRSFTRLA